jgi:DNA-binding NarL/FixJ family response regulator
MQTLGSLSASEREVLLLMADGLRNREIGRRLCKSEKTIEKQIAKIFVKLDLHDTSLDRRVLAIRILLSSQAPGLSLLEQAF